MVSFGNNHFPGSDTSFYHYIVLEFGAEFDKTSLYSGVFAHDINIGSAFFDNNRFQRNDIGIFSYVKQKFYFGKLSRKQYLFRIRHFCTYGESTCLGIDLRFCKIDITFVRINSIISQSNRDIRLPRAGRILTAYLYIALFAFKIVQCGHAEIYQYRITFYYGSKQ